MSSPRPGRARRQLVVGVAGALALTGSVLVGVAVARQAPEPPAVEASPEAAGPRRPTGTTTTPAAGERLTGAASPLARPPAAAAARAAPAPPGVPPLPRSRPVHLTIPALDVDTGEFVDLGLDDDGAMEVPTGAGPVGWYTPSPTPGETGPSVLAAHVSWNGARGTFFELGRMRPGDVVRVGRDDGSTAVFEVTGVEQYAKDEFPTFAVYGNTDGAELRLITCGGQFDERSRHYRDNIVVYAELFDTARP